MRTVIHHLAIALLVGLLGGGVLAQSGRGSLRGVVIDSRGNAVRNARVVLLYSNKIAIRETTTGERGDFFFERLKAGDYSLSVDVDALTQSGGPQPVRIVHGQEFQLVIPMTVAAIEDAVIVTATRTDSRLVETGASAFVAQGADLLRAQRINLFDALRSSPGVIAMQTGRRGGITSLFIRGGESDYTKVLIDGVPANDAGGQFDFGDLTTDNAARIELVRGAQSAIYGSDAMSGVLQIFTHRGATPAPEMVVSAEGGSFAFNRQFARFSGLLGDLDYSASFTHLATDGRFRNDDYQNRVATANLGYRFTARTQLRATVRSDNSGLGAPGATAKLFADPDERAERRRVATALRIEDQTTKYWRQTLTFVYSGNNYLSFDPAAQDLTKPDTPADPGVAFNDFASLFNNNQRRRGLRYQSDFVLPNAHFISAGVDYDQERAVFDSGFTGRNRVPADRRNVGAFLQDQFSYGPRIFVTAGIRIENNRSDLPASFAKALRELNSPAYIGDVGFGSVVAPKIALTYILRPSGIQSRRGQTRLKFNYGEGMKAPTLVETFSPSPFFLGNPALKPERSRNADISLEQFFLKDRIRVEGTYFDNRFRDQIAFIANPSTYGGPIQLADGRLTHYINNDRARSTGVELTANWHPKRFLQFGGTYTLLRTNLEVAADVIDFNTLQLVPNREIGLPLLRRPRHSGSINAAWIGEKLDLNLDGVFIGKRRDLDPVLFSAFDTRGNPIYNRGFAKIDIAGTWRFNSHLSFFARIENLLNRNYEEVLGYPAYRLNFSAGLRVRIGGGK